MTVMSLIAMLKYWISCNFTLMVVTNKLRFIVDWDYWSYSYTWFYHVILLSTDLDMAKSYPTTMALVSARAPGPLALAPSFSVIACLTSRPRTLEGSSASMRMGTIGGNMRNWCPINMRKNWTRASFLLRLFRPRQEVCCCFLGPSWVTSHLESFRTGI